MAIGIDEHGSGASIFGPFVQRCMIARLWHAAPHDPLPTDPMRSGVRGSTAGMLDGPVSLLSKLVREKQTFVKGLNSRAHHLVVM